MTGDLLAWSCASILRVSRGSSFSDLSMPVEGLLMRLLLGNFSRCCCTGRVWMVFLSCVLKADWSVLWFWWAVSMVMRLWVCWKLCFWSCEVEQGCGEVCSVGDLDSWKRDGGSMSGWLDVRLWGVIWLHSKQCCCYYLLYDLLLCVLFDFELQ